MELTVEQRLEIYKLMLKDYKWRPFGFLTKTSRRTRYGFCSWLLDTFNCRINIWDLPELYALRPDNLVGLHWFKPGLERPRYQLLLKAIAAANKNYLYKTDSMI